MATCKICGSDKPRFGSCSTCEASAAANWEAHAAAKAERQIELEREHGAALIRNSVRNMYDDFSGRHLIEASSSVTFTSKEQGRLDGRLEAILQFEFTADLSADMAFMGFRRTGPDWKWLNYFHDQLFFILDGSAFQVETPYTHFQVIDRGVTELVGFNPSPEQIALMISDREWRARAGLWETKPKPPTHEIFQEALNRKAMLLSGEPVPASESTAAASNDTVAAIIRVVQPKVPPGAPPVHAQSRFFEDLGFDPLGFVEVIMSLEEAFNIQINDADVKNLTTVADCAAYIDGLSG